MDQGTAKLDQLRDDILGNRLDRRSVLKRAMLLGLSAPVIASLLAACGGDDGDSGEDATATTGGGQTEATPTAAPAEATDAPAEASPTAAPAEASPTEAAVEATATEAGTGMGRGTGDLLRILYWQAPTILNPHFAQGDKDSSAASLVLEPLITFDADGNPVAVLAEEAPSLENGGISEDGTTITYKLRQDIVWSDGEPFTAADVEFTWQYVTNLDTSAVTIASYQVIESLTVVDDYTIEMTFATSNPAWFTPFSTGYGGAVLPKHILADFVGTAARDAEFNLKPVGTGPYIVADFKPGDVVVYEINENYRVADKPFFKTVEMKGGGDATGAARAAIQSGETDWAWNLQVEKAVLEEIAASSDSGELLIRPGNSVERILVNFADPNAEVDGARSELSTPHPFLQFLEVRQAFAMACDRETIATEIYGPSGQATSNLLVGPVKFASPNTSFVFDVEAASAQLEAEGWTGGPRSKDGVEMKVLYQTTINPVRQKTQEIVKQAWEEMGVPTELKSIDAAVYFSSDAGNPDTAAHFYADFEMFTNGPTSPYPIDYMLSWRSSEPEIDIAQKANEWSGSNYARFINEEYNELWEQARTELDPDKQIELFVGMNDIAVNEVAEIPLIHRAAVTGVNAKLRGFTPSSWDPDPYDVANWYMEE